MKQVLTILMLCSTIICDAQTTAEIKYFYSVKNNNDSTYKYFMSFLNKFDSLNGYKNFFCEKAAERVGDYYKSKQDYVRAIAYYDSADTKYRDVIANAGDNYYEEFIPRRFKLSQCYVAIKNIRQAIVTLTPYIFDHRGASYFDSFMTSYYVSTLHLRYTKTEIKEELKKALDSVTYKSSFRRVADNSATFMNVNCALKIFDTELELAGFETLLKSDDQIPAYTTKDFFISRFKELTIYKLLQN